MPQSIKTYNQRMNKIKPYKNYIPFQYIEEMIEEGKYIEAIVLVSGYIEVFLEAVIVEVAYRNSKEKGFSSINIESYCDNNNLRMNMNIAVYLGLLDKKLFDKMTFFRNERNQVVHDVFKLSHKTDRHFKSLIKNGLEIFHEISTLHDSLLKSALKQVMGKDV